MEYLNIKKVGKRNTVRNVVDRNSFERIYKPKGWVEDGVIETKKIETTKETEIIERAAAEKKKEKQAFDDKIIKGD